MSIREALRRLYVLFSPSLRSELKWAWLAVSHVGRKCRFWTWVRVSLSPTGSTHAAVYSGTAGEAEAAALQLQGIGAAVPDAKSEPVVVSELLLPGSLRVPRYIQPVVPLDRSIEDILAGYGDKLRRVVRQQLPKVELREARTTELIDFADQAMLRPYAAARYGPGADQLSAELVHELSTRSDGRLDILYVNGEPLACHLGFERLRRGKRYWNAIRFGFVPAVFEDTKRLHEINSVNVFLATRRAKEQGFDFYGLGDCLGRPDDGLLHWKRRRGGSLDASQCQDWFYVRLPADGACRFLWATPLFSAAFRGLRLTLHVGVPAERSDEELMSRYREMSFAGLHQLVIHAEQPLSAAAMDFFSQLLSGSPSTLITCQMHPR